MNIYVVFILSFLILTILGTLLHFTHGWFKKGVLLHIFSALNESTWEHMKLLIAPTVFVGIFQYLFLWKNYENIFNAVLVLMFVEVITIPLLYEPLRMLVKKVPFPITILIFLLSVVFGLIAEYFVLKKEIFLFPEYVSLIIIFVIICVFGILTYYPPKFFLFKDPITKRYGDIE